MSFTVRSQHKFYSANQDNEEIATAIVYKKQDTFWLTDVWVHPKHRQKGLGTQVINEVIKDYGQHDLYLGVHGYTDVPLSDEQLTTWYSSFGFELTSVRTIMKRRGTSND